MQRLKNENAQLNKLINGYMEEIQKQKDLNAQHQSEIETLLKFNQRLLGIIENQLGNNKKDNCSLQPISERSQRESDMLGQPVFQSLIKNRNIAVRSQWGGPTKESLIDRANLINKKNNFFDQKSQNQSIRNEEQSLPTVKQQHLVSSNIQRKMSECTTVKNQMQQDIKELQDFKNTSSKFYDTKVNQIRKLSDKLGKYQPMDQIQKITQKMSLSSKTADLIKQRVMKNST